MAEIYKNVMIQRSDAITILVRLELADIPFPHSRRCRQELIRCLSQKLMEEPDNIWNTVIEISSNELNLSDEDIESAMKIIENYAIC